MLHISHNKIYSVLLNKIQACLQNICILLTYINRWLPNGKVQKYFTIRRTKGPENYQLAWMVWYFCPSHLSRWFYRHLCFAVKKEHQHVPSEAVNITRSVHRGHEVTYLNKNISVPRILVPNHIIYLFHTTNRHIYFY